MSDEQEEFENVPVPCEALAMGDGDLLVFDWGEFCEAFDCFAASWTSGQLFVLDRQTKRWREISPKTAEKKKLGLIKGDT